LDHFICPDGDHIRRWINACSIANTSLGPSSTPLDTDTPQPSPTAEVVASTQPTGMTIDLSVSQPSLHLCQVSNSWSRKAQRKREREARSGNRKAGSKCPPSLMEQMVQSSITVRRLLLLCGGTKMGLLERAVAVDLYLSVKYNHSKQHRFPQNRKWHMTHCGWRFLVFIARLRSHLLPQDESLLVYHIAQFVTYSQGGIVRVCRA
jgi:hypothetical protein